MSAAIASWCGTNNCGECDVCKLVRAAKTMLNYIPTKGETIRSGYGAAREELRSVLYDDA